MLEQARILCITALWLLKQKVHTKALAQHIGAILGSIHRNWPQSRRPIHQAQCDIDGPEDWRELRDVPPLESSSEGSPSLVGKRGNWVEPRSMLCEARMHLDEERETKVDPKPRCRLHTHSEHSCHIVWCG
ncbi:hypothetical protein Nepgr_020554 [Nepenthes gracilis]|uniref:Uncharacterized protein n=1 Tax=Nepenthes gracilis TaxID=150966 RepID=A0AAD3SWB0_NEPGR|nr:hypothetical protein Nepgr_020554 [Nepenthes gracilis]